MVVRYARMGCVPGPVSFTTYHGGAVHFVRSHSCSNSLQGMCCQTGQPTLMQVVLALLVYGFAREHQ